MSWYIMIDEEMWYEMCGDISSDVIAQIGWHWTSILYFQVVGPHSFAYEALFKQVKTIIDIFMFLEAL